MPRIILKPLEDLVAEGQIVPDSFECNKFRPTTWKKCLTETFSKFFDGYTALQAIPLPDGSYSVKLDGIQWVQPSWVLYSFQGLFMPEFIPNISDRFVFSDWFTPEQVEELEASIS